jgi:hypothetical protein
MSQRIVVAIDGWEADSMYPSGHYVRALGPIGDKDTETVGRRRGGRGCGAGLGWGGGGCRACQGLAATGRRWDLGRGA